ncbi:lysophospholipase [Jatrophihabitans telluris]|uniref:Lysophospholipase n=1 Tax=Jatrophihabitans telluris TaxID=2038343 RepID=A0ABY4QZC4_9ACTN|nr:alpha/beta fold hydrolase [Jatrophihabitans telluris]UQX88452.1 lysophospholipase [Jatrophihabitans telluris]
MDEAVARRTKQSDHRARAEHRSHVVLTPRLVDVRLPKGGRRPRGAVIVLHGGASRQGSVMVSPTQLSVLRMIPIAKRISRAGHGELAVFRLLNSSRGWDAHHTPVDDAHWALRQIADRFGLGVPVCLVGHSLGGRAALLAADHHTVVGAVALAPWVYSTDGPDLTGRSVLIVHGSQDRIASPVRSWQVARNISRHTHVGYLRVDGGKHAMLSRHRVFDSAAAQFCAATLLGEQMDGPVAQALVSKEPVVV